MATRTGRTKYSEKIKGNRGNHNFQSRFDMSDGYLRYYGANATRGGR